MASATNISLMDAIYARRAVRQYTEELLSLEVREELEAAIRECNVSGGLDMKAYYGHSDIFESRSAKRAKFKNVRNFILVTGPTGPELEQRCGYWGELIVLKLIQMGLDCCWVGKTFSRSEAQRLVRPGNKLVAIITFGCGAQKGVPHGGKFLEDVISVKEGEQIPIWFRQGAEAALLAPTAKCSQNFKLSYSNDEARIRMTRKNAFSEVDKGIVKCHFEMVSGHKLQ